ncbi:G-PROTEIN-RECEP-F1-2 domain-containing protein [Aphelenchoides fujianensis]|nr:G-PROTEIN-RECEP-F1-2 domain-containing protein [Aphelenchoides fujianensis]
MESWDLATSTLESLLEAEEEAEECALPEIPEHRWYLVAVAGTSLSIISLISNILIARVLLQRRYSNFFFLGLLAISDSFLSFCYGPVISAEILRYMSLWLARLLSCFLIILGTIERYLVTVKSPFLGSFQHARGRLAIGVLLLAMGLRGTFFFEIQIVKNGNCTGVLEYDAALTPLVAQWFYGTIFRFYIRTLMTVFIPFALLSYLNYKIVNILRKQQRSAAIFRYGTSEHKAGGSGARTKIRSATILFLLIVFSYLCANSLNVGITAWEYIDLSSIETFYEVYEILADTSSLLYIVTCATRLLVYLSCNEEIRHAIFNYLMCQEGKNAVPHAYKPIQKFQYEDSMRTKSITLGTNFDRIAIAMVLSHCADQQRVVSVEAAPKEANGHTVVEHKAESIRRVSLNKTEDNSSFVISNPLASVSPPSSPKEKNHVVVNLK